MRIVGINAAYHESSVALVEDGRVVVAAEEERFNRVRHGKPARIETAGDLPLAALDACLAHAGWEPASVDRFAYSFDPAARRAANLDDDGLPLEPEVDDGWVGGPPSGYGTGAGEAALEGAIRAAPALLARHFDRERVTLDFLPHHYCHAAHAFFSAGGGGDVAVLVMDGIGEGRGWQAFRPRGAALVPIEDPPREPGLSDSLGLLWEKTAAYLGLQPGHDEANVMALAAFGDPARTREAFARHACFDGRRGLVVDGRFYGFRRWRAPGMEEAFGPPRKPGSPLWWEGPEAHHAHVAAGLQAVTEEILAEAAAWVAGRTGARRLALAGGVALNCVANGKLARSGKFVEVFVPSAPHDAGTALGAAWLAGLAKGVAPVPCTSARLGVVYPPGATEAALAGHGLKVRPVDPARLARLLAEGQVVARFVGRAEFGPRALGHRSFLASPRNPAVGLRLSREIKRREPWRPLAAVLTRPEAERLFTLPTPLPRASAWMAFAFPARPPARELVPGALHADGCSRIQVLGREEDPELHDCLERFGRLAGVEALVNTGFNLHEPLVETPDEAVRTFLRSGADLLWIGPHLVAR